MIAALKGQGQWLNTLSKIIVHVVFQHKERGITRPNGFPLSCGIERKTSDMTAFGLMAVRRFWIAETDDEQDVIVATRHENRSVD